MRPTDLHRRTFLAAGAASLGAAVSGPAAAAPFFARTKLPIGIQLYTVGPDATKDLDGTLQALGQMGYRTVELAGLYGRTPGEMRAALDKAGLKAPSAHIQGRGGEGSFSGDMGKLAQDLNTLGATTAIMPSPYVPDHALAAAKGRSGADYFRAMLAAMTAEDWRMNARFLNEKAAALKSAGIRVGYHNHNVELAPLEGGPSGFEILLQETDPALVTFEIDVGWVAAAGIDPLALIRKHKGRFTLMHVKDLKATSKPNYDLAMDPTEVGSGKIDWAKLLPAAYAEGVRSFFVEQEAPFAFPRLQAAKISHDYLAKVSG